jgi:hypothetical protein
VPKVQRKPAPAQEDPTAPAGKTTPKQNAPGKKEPPKKDVPGKKLPGKLTPSGKFGPKKDESKSVTYNYKGKLFS